MCGSVEAYASEGGTGPLPCLLRYDGQLLALAVELATRLLPAFDTPTGLPVHRVNLATGAQDALSRQTCAAAAGTYLLEFGLLSRLTGDPMFEAVARRATAALWSRRSAIQLVPSGCVEKGSRRGCKMRVSHFSFRLLHPALMLTMGWRLLGTRALEQGSTRFSSTSSRCAARTRSSVCVPCPTPYALFAIRVEFFSTTTPLCARMPKRLRPLQSTCCCGTPQRCHRHLGLSTWRFRTWR